MDTTAIGTLSRTAYDATANLQKISTAKRVNQAADDPAGLAIAKELSVQSTSERAAVRNTNDAMSMVQTAEGATATTTDALVRMRELAVAASSGTVSGSARQALQDEFSQLQQQLDTTAAQTAFNGQALTDGSRASVAVQTGTGSQDQTDVALPDLRGGTLGVAGLDLTSAAGSQAAIDQLDQAISQVSQGRSELGAAHNRLSSAANTGTTRIEAQEAARSRIEDADFAKVASQQASLQIQQQASVAATVQSRNIERSAVLGLL